MKLFGIIIIAAICLTLMQCKSAKQLDEMADKEIVLESTSEISVGQVYFQKWTAGQESGGSGINIYFPNLINKNDYVIENVYFRGLVGKMRIGKASYFANLKYDNRDIIMSNEPNAEYGNSLPNNSEFFSFELKENECIVSYKADNETKYYKIKNIVEKAGEYFPSAPPKQNKE